MIKIFLTRDVVEWQKGNKRYRCFRRFNGEKAFYCLYVADVKHGSRMGMPIKIESLANINKWLEKTEVEIAED